MKSSSGSMKRFLLICRYCDDDVLTVDRIGVHDLEHLKTHITTQHPGVASDNSPNGVATVLKHFHVKRLSLAAAALLGRDG